MDIKLKYDIDDIDWELVSEILSIAGLSSPEPSICKKAFHGSAVTAFAFVEGKMIGFACLVVILFYIQTLEKKLFMKKWVSDV